MIQNVFKMQFWVGVPPVPQLCLAKGRPNEQMMNFLVYGFVFHEIFHIIFTHPPPPETGLAIDGPMLAKIDLP
jgi:hypothetical protein